LVQLIKQAQHLGFKVIATLYVAPARDAIDSLLMKDGLASAVVEAGVDGLEYDLEGEWSKSPVCGYSNHREAAQQLVARSRELRERLPVGVTTHLGRAGDKKIGTEYFDWLAMQAYSTCSIAKGCSSYDDRSGGPGYKQALVSRATSAFNGPVIVGLAAYHQRWPGHSIGEAMARSLKAVADAKTTDGRIVGHSYWSSSWLPAGSSQVNFLMETASSSP